MTLPALHVVRVVLEPKPRGFTAVGLVGHAERRFYYGGEAESAGVCMALRAAADGVGRGEIDVADGLLVQVEFQRARSRAPKARARTRRKAKATP